MNEEMVQGLQNVDWREKMALRHLKSLLSSDVRIFTDLMNFLTSGLTMSSS